jgi:hypothetical protein
MIKKRNLVCFFFGEEIQPGVINKVSKSMQKLNFDIIVEKVDKYQIRPHYDSVLFIFYSDKEETIEKLMIDYETYHKLLRGKILFVTQSNNIAKYLDFFENNSDIFYILLSNQISNTTDEIDKKIKNVFGDKTEKL